MIDPLFVGPALVMQDCFHAIDHILAEDHRFMRYFATPSGKRRRR